MGAWDHSSSRAGSREADTPLEAAWPAGRAAYLVTTWGDAPNVRAARRNSARECGSVSPYCVSTSS